MVNRNRATSLSAVIGLLIIASFSRADDSMYLVATEKNEIKLMSYNVENLFDAQHDEGKNDYEFLPKSSPLKKYCDGGQPAPTTPSLSFFTTNALSFQRNSCKDTDWTEEKVTLKLTQLVRAVSLQGHLPDIMVLQEAENTKVVGRLAQALRYDGMVMTSGSDGRGINNAVLYLNRYLRPLDFAQEPVPGTISPTRNVSSAHFQVSPVIGGGVLGIYPVHWPSQRNPTIERTKAAAALRNFIIRQRQRFAGQTPYFGVVVGDTNISERNDSPDPMRTIIQDQAWSSAFLDVHDAAVAAGQRYIPLMPQGTYYYGRNKEWNRLDRILTTRELMTGTGLRVNLDSYRIMAPLAISRSNPAGERIPWRYNVDTTDPQKAGLSDHYPVLVKLRYK
jgi:endonuclease/exonuclease/phosphatase family metal-dependent hydrolase